MKIKKLFHWLYAILMLLPVFYIGGRTLYTIFNKNAKDSYSEYVVSNETRLNNGDIAYAGQLITFTSSNPSTLNNGQVFYVYNNQTNLKEAFGLSGSYGINYINFIWEGTRIRIQFFETDTGTQHNVFRQLTDYWSFWIVNKNDVTIGNADYYYNVYVTTYSVGTLDNAFIYSVNQLNEESLFSWAKTSYLIQPFSYISGLFGIDTTNPINTMLSYWLAISIIWLVFDLVMYLPLLVHRWLDKGGIE